MYVLRFYELKPRWHSYDYVHELIRHFRSNLRFAFSILLMKVFIGNESAMPFDLHTYCEILYASVHSTQGHQQQLLKIRMFWIGRKNLWSQWRSWKKKGWTQSNSKERSIIKNDASEMIKIQREVTRTKCVEKRVLRYWKNIEPYSSHMSSRGTECRVARCSRRCCLEFALVPFSW